MEKIPTIYKIIMSFNGLVILLGFISFFFLVAGLFFLDPVLAIYIFLILQLSSSFITFLVKFLANRKITAIKKEYEYSNLNQVIYDLCNRKIICFEDGKEEVGSIHLEDNMIVMNLKGDSQVYQKEIGDADSNLYDSLRIVQEKGDLTFYRNGFPYEVNIGIPDMTEEKA